MAVKQKPRKRITKLEPTFVSLLKKGANLTPALLKGEGIEDGGHEIRALVKTGSEGLLHALIYIPEHPDSDNMVASKEVIRDACHSHEIQGGQIDLRHNCKPLEKGQVTVVENMILQSQDPRFSQYDRMGRMLDHRGAWAKVIQIHDPELRKEAEAGNLGEVSLYAPQGSFELKDEPLTKSETTTPPTMDPEQFKQMLAAITEGNKAVSEKLDTLAKSQETDDTDDKSEDIPPFTIDEKRGPVLSKGQALTSQDRVDFIRAKQDWIMSKALEKAETPEDLAKCQAAEKDLAKARAEEDKNLGMGVSVDSMLGQLGLSKADTDSTPDGAEALSKSQEDDVIKSLDSIQAKRNSTPVGV